MWPGWETQSSRNSLTRSPPGLGRLMWQPFLSRRVLASVKDAQAFERALRQKRDTSCGRGCRAHSEEQNLAAGPTTQELGSHFHHLWRPFLEEACWLSLGHG